MKRTFYPWTALGLLLLCAQSMAQSNSGASINKPAGAIEKTPFTTPAKLQTGTSAGSAQALNPQPFPPSEVKINQQRWEEVEKLSDKTILVLPDGKRTTVGEVRSERQRVQAKRTSAPQRTLLKKVAQRRMTLPNVQKLSAEESQAAKGVLRPVTQHAASSVLSAAGLKAARPAFAGCEACVTTINGKAIARVVFIPGNNGAATQYVIHGKGFGEVRGAVNLSGDFTQRIALRVDSWQDDQIVAYFEDILKGELDHANVGLVVVRQNGKEIATPTQAKFVAARADYEVGLSSIPDARIRYALGDQLQRKANGYWLIAYNPHSATRDAMTDTINLAAPGLLKVGFEVTEAQVDIYQPPVNSSQDIDGCAGGQYAYGQSSAQWRGDDLLVTRPMGESHHSPNYNPLSLCSIGDNIFTSGVNSIRLTVRGPKGFSVSDILKP